MSVRILSVLLDSKLRMDLPVATNGIDFVRNMTDVSDYDSILVYVDGMPYGTLGDLPIFARINVLTIYWPATELGKTIHFLLFDSPTVRTSENSYMRPRMLITLRMLVQSTLVRVPPRYVRSATIVYPINVLLPDGSVVSQSSARPINVCSSETDMSNCVSLSPGDALTVGTLSNVFIRSIDNVYVEIVGER